MPPCPQLAPQHAPALTITLAVAAQVRNLTGNPIAGVDPHELVDTRPILYEMQVRGRGCASVCAGVRW